MKKIGILTFHRANNYGAVLQAYALQHVISAKGFDCEIIDYRNNKIEDAFHYTSMKKKLINVVKFFAYHKYYEATKEKNRKFECFRHTYLRCSRHYRDADAFCGDYNAVIVGSDQVWNPNITANDHTYFLPYKVGATKLTYAASFGSDNMNNDSNSDHKTYFNSFESLLIREGAGITYLSSLGNRQAKKVLDPTLLLRKKDWVKLCRSFDRVIKERYIVLYLVAPSTNATSLAKKISRKYGLNIYHLDPGRVEREGIINVKDAGPDELLWFISNAEYVITTSYHGLILSLNFNTRFLFEMNHNANNTNSRLYEVMKTYNLERYLIESDDDSDYCELEYNWDEINKHIDFGRKESMALLYESLEAVD